MIYLGNIWGENWGSKGASSSGISKNKDLKQEHASHILRTTRRLVWLELSKYRGEKEMNTGVAGAVGGKPCETEEWCKDFGFYFKWCEATGKFFFFFLFVVNFVIHWNKTAMGLHVFPIPIPPPTSLSTRSP